MEHVLGRGTGCGRSLGGEGPPGGAGVGWPAGPQADTKLRGRVQGYPTRSHHAIWVLLVFRKAHWSPGGGSLW